MSSYASSLNWILSQESTLIERLSQWVGINTYSLNCTGLNQLLQVLDDAFKPLGGKSQLISLPPYQKLSPTGTLQSHPLGQALSIRSRPSAPIQILLAGHLDTVFSPSSPFQSLQQQDNQRLSGPGAADMKGGIAILLTLLEAVERSPFKDSLGWEVLITPDEEIGSPGSGPLYREAARRHDCALIFEPAFSDGAFVNERKGSSNFTI
ncbi:MAG: M20/M25/M40 family metallo-hydrolase, partial [Cyanobacteria bacterium]|nr:M20/M25/M40 family metallo-hydrolase [Cyanobacteriota bacterium]